VIRRMPLLLLALLLLLPSCRSAGRAGPGIVMSDRDLSPPLSRVIRIFEAGTGDELGLEALLVRLAREDAVFLGETHLDEVTHRVEHAVLEGLLALEPGEVVLAMEMFTRADQEAIDAYLAGGIDGEEFAKRARLWSNYPTGYRALVETARRAGIPVIGSNLAPGPQRKVGMGGAEALAALDAEERSGVAEELFPNSPLYWERFDRTVRGHGAGFLPTTEEGRLVSVQSLWDNTMGESCARALAAHPGSTVLHINGGFHTRGGLGTAEQFARRAPEASFATVAIVPVDDRASVEPSPGDDRGDFVVFVEARARGYSEGTRAVTLHRELEYRLHLPTERPEAGAPLLVWLPAPGASVGDEATRLRLLLGEEAAIAVIEFPFPELAEDLHRTGRYAWDDSFDADLGALGGAVYAVIEQVTRYFPVDPERVVLAGADGAAPVAASLRWMDRGGPSTVAISPGPVGRLGDAGLPDPRDPKGGELLVLVGTADSAAWQAELGARRAVGYPGRLEILPAGASGLHALRRALGLLPGPQRSGPARLILRHGSSLARQWAGLVGARTGGAARVEVATDGSPAPTGGEGTLRLEARLRDGGGAVALEPELLMSGRGIPMPQGAFGGTVVLVLPEETEDAARAAWRRLEEEDVTRQRSRFVGVRVAETGRERDLPAVLGELRDEGKSVVRIVPVAFCATAEEMRALRGSIDGHDAGLRIAWTPGLGGGLWEVLPAGGEGAP